MAAIMAISELNLADFMNSVRSSSGNSSFQLRSLRSSISRPSAAALRSSASSSCLILVRALEVTTQASQSRLGRWFFPVMISTTSPVLSFSLICTGLPLTLPPVQRLPRLVWMLNAKSSTDEPAASMRSSPVGVNTKMSLSGGAGRCSGLASRGCSSESRTDCSQRSIEASWRMPLYAQCAALPLSASMSMRFVRIWTSRAWPSLFLTVMCSDS